MRQNRPPTARRLAAAIAALTLVAACGGDDGAGDATATTATSADDTATDTETDGDTGSNASSDAAEGDDSSDASTDASTDAGETDTDDLGGSYVPGDIGYRIVNALDEPVDLYVRTTGLVEAFPIASGVAPGTVTELAYPPESGTFLVTEAGAGDPTCVATCPHIISALSAYPEEGPVRTVLLYTDEFGERRSYELWEQPDPIRTGTSNAMVETDPGTSLAVIVASALRDADFGLRLSLTGSGTCAEPVNLSNVLVGGSQTPAFALGAGTAEVQFHANDDRECSGEPVGGPFTIAGAAGTRTIVVLLGAPGSMDAIVVPMLDGDAPGVGTSTDGDDTDEGSASGGAGAGGAGGAGGDADLATELLGEAIEFELGFPADQSRCAAAIMVEAIGADVLLDGDELVDLDALPFDVQDTATDALIVAIGRCDIDPSLLGD